jgi:hypothetical protein
MLRRASVRGEREGDPCLASPSPWPRACPPGQCYGLTDASSLWAGKQARESCAKVLQIHPWYPGVVSPPAAK